MVKRIIETANENLANTPAPIDTVAPIENTPAPIILSAVEVALAIVATLETTIASMPTGAAQAYMQSALNEALGELALLQADAALQGEKDAKIEAAFTVASGLPENMRDSLLAGMLAAIDAEYAPVSAESELPSIEMVAALGAGILDRAATQSDSSRAANAAAAADPALQSAAAALFAAWNRDSGKLACSVGPRPNTRFAGMVVLAPSGAGVQNASDYATQSRAVMAFLIAQGWTRKASDGVGVCESKWLAARGPYAAGGKPSAHKLFQSGAAIAQYADGSFKLAYPGTVGVRFLHTDNAAWNAFVGAGNTPTVVEVVEVAPALPSGAPTPPSVQANAMGALTTTARCSTCGASNLSTAAVCRNAACTSTVFASA